MKKYLLFTLVAFITLNVSAQETKPEVASFSIGPELAQPVGDWSDGNSFGLGLSALGEFMVDKSVGINLSAGYINFFGKKYNTGFGEAKGSSVSQVPLLAGVRYYFIKDIFLSGQLGVSFFNRNLGSAFTYAPGIGFKFSVLDATLKYMGATKYGETLSNVSLRVGYTF